jgi:hypothetical protein
LRSQRKVSSLAWLFCLWTLLVVCFPALADSGKRQTRIICRQELSLAKRAELTGKLQRITGWTELGFDEGGSLRPGSRAAAGGSETARNLLTQALSGTNILILEDASNRADVVFSEVVPGRWKETGFQGPPVYVVRIDFSDFDHLMGDQPALDAFDVGWGLLHEIDHIVNDSIDSEVLGRVGDCEDHLNQMRRELRLPERSDYFFTFFPHSKESGFSTRLVRLAFNQKEPASNKHRRYWLIWDATVVGGVGGAKQIAALR